MSEHSFAPLPTPTVGTASFVMLDSAADGLATGAAQRGGTSSASAIAERLATVIPGAARPAPVNIDPLLEATMPEGILPFSFDTLANQVVDSPFASPQDTLEAVRAEADRLREQARQEGFAQGLTEGRENARAELAGAIESLGDAVRGVAEAERQALAQCEIQVAELALRMGEQMLAGVLDVQPERVLDVARNALRRLADRRRVTIVVSPVHLELLTGALPDIRSELGGIELLDVQADRRVGPGGVIVRTSAGEIDASIETQLRRAREITAAVLAGDGHAEPDEDQHP